MVVFDYLNLFNFSDQPKTIISLSLGATRVFGYTKKVTWISDKDGNLSTQFIPKEQQEAVCYLKFDYCIDLFES